MRGAGDRGARGLLLTGNSYMQARHGQTRGDDPHMDKRQNRGLEGRTAADLSLSVSFYQGESTAQKMGLLGKSRRGRELSSWTALPAASSVGLAGWRVGQMAIPRPCSDKCREQGTNTGHTKVDIITATVVSAKRKARLDKLQVPFLCSCDCHLLFHFVAIPARSRVEHLST